MYQSRLHATNGLITLTVDALSGELLELVNEKTWDNVIKSHQRAAYTPFRLEGFFPAGKGESSAPAFQAVPPRYAQMLADPELKPQLNVRQDADSAHVTLDYPHVMTESGKLDIAVRITVDLPAGSCKTVWQIEITHHLPGLEIQRALFPYVSGVWLGDDWSDDILVLPMHAGQRVVNPVATLVKKPASVQWKWQEYMYDYQLGGPYGAPGKNGAHHYELPYSGAGSMLWMDLFDENENTGLYITCRNENLVMKALRVESFGEEKPGLSLMIVHYPCLTEGTWKSDPCIIALHEGDWHWAADDYREWRQTVLRPQVQKHRPEWFEKSPGLAAHYDFQYQGGGIVHRFADIPALYDKALALGMNHLLLSGWNVDGFDNGFPQYTPNPNLGTEQDLIDAVRAVRERGGHVAFYLNARLCNIKYESRADLIKNSAIMERSGNLHIEQYGARDLSFASMCPEGPAWHDEFVGVVNYLTHTIGADSMYLDQLAMGPSVLCYHPDHKEHEGNPAGWNQGYERMLENMRAGYDPDGMALLYEGCSDIHGEGVSGQLVSTMFYLFSGAYPELYKYTFPDQILVDMMNPRRHSGMRADHVARRSTELLYKAFVVGSYLWTYDLEWDNGFDRDPEQAERLLKQNTLRRHWLEAYGQGRFVDNKGLGAVPEKLLVKRFELERGALLAVANEHHVSGEISIEWLGDALPRLTVRTLEAPSVEAETEYRIAEANGKRSLVITAPDSELAVLVLR
ncbi:hypothetical protein AGMMS49992_16940 [Clostridia bacterium]|nr:hypothetical protein AGMMS49992_16940 [Clostridia bacterium]